jgi:hypothetical protein
MDKPFTSGRRNHFFSSKTVQYFDFYAYFEMAYQLNTLLTHSQKPRKALISGRSYSRMGTRKSLKHCLKI